MTALFAHQGGWDELLITVVPAAVLGLIVVVLVRRSERSGDDGDEGDDGDDDSSADGDGVA